MVKNNKMSESDAELVAHLVRVSGREIKSRRDIDRYVDELTSRANARRSKREHLKTALLMALLLAAAGQYYFIDVQLQILSQPTLTVFVPAPGSSAPRLIGS